MALGMLILVVFSALFSFSYGRAQADTLFILDGKNIISGFNFLAANIRIVNGTDAREGEFPYAASLRHNARHVCGATILNERHALTAAHCICEENRPLDPTFYSIQYGSIHISETFQRSVRVARIYCNDFSMARLTYDAAVLVLAQPLSRDYLWQPVTLYRDFDTRLGHRGVIIGWGRLWQDGPIPSVLQKLEVEIYPDSICGRLFEITQHVCFGAPVGGACNGDSGTSLMVEGKQVAIASFITTTCGTANTTHPNVYSKITASLDFIDNILNSS